MGFHGVVSLFDGFSDLLGRLGVGGWVLRCSLSGWLVRMVHCLVPDLAGRLV